MDKLLNAHIPQNVWETENYGRGHHEAYVGHPAVKIAHLKLIPCTSITYKSHVFTLSSYIQCHWCHNLPPFVFSATVKTCFHNSSIFTLKLWVVCPLPSPVTVLKPPEFDCGSTFTANLIFGYVSMWPVSSLCCSLRNCPCHSSKGNDDSKLPQLSSLSIIFREQPCRLHFVVQVFLSSHTHFVLKGFIWEMCWQQQ